MRRLEGKGIVVTGGTGDIGVAMEAFVKQGSMVALIDRKTPSEAELWLERYLRHVCVRCLSAAQ